VLLADSVQARAGVCLHRDTNTYPAIQNATGSIAIIPFAAFNIVFTPFRLCQRVCSLRLTDHYYGPRLGGTALSTVG